MQTLKKVTLRLYAEDIDTLKRAYPYSGYNDAIRKMVHDFAEKVEEALAKKDGN